MGGTSDGRKLVQHLVKEGQEVGVIALSCYGKELAREDGAVVFEEKIPADPGEWLKNINVRAVVDARHSSVFDNYNSTSDDWVSVCDIAGIPFYRIGREETVFTENELIHTVYSMEEAAEKAAQLGKNIFLTTGSHGLEPFLRLKEKYGIRLVVRVLPEHRVIKKCQDMGIKPKDIVAMQGPFSKQVNKVLFKMYRASVVVTKDSGKAGGTDTKLSAALSLKIPVVIIKRKASGPVFKWQEVFRLLRENEKNGGR